MISFRQNSTVVLVHGAWADGSCWKDVILSFERQGLKVACAPIPLTSLSDDVSALTRALERTSGPLVLVGHAYGGAVIGAIYEERVRSFAYVAALAADEGETVAQVFYRGEPHAEAPKLAPDKHGFIWMPEDGFRRALAHKASTDQNRVVAAVQRPISVRCIEEAASVPGWKSKPSWFLLAEEDRMINPKTQRFYGWSFWKRRRRPESGREPRQSRVRQATSGVRQPPDRTIIKQQNHLDREFVRLSLSIAWPNGCILKSSLLDDSWPPQEKRT